MKIILILINLIIHGTLISQNISNILAPLGSFVIKDNTNTFFSLNQSNGSINLISPLEGNLRSSIFLGGDKFLHNYNNNGSVGRNLFLGLNAGNFSMNGSNEQASHNLGFGFQSLTSLASGSYNSALGYLSLRNNSSGGFNSALGCEPLYRNTTGSNNSAFGFRSIYNNTIGSNNSAFGMDALSDIDGSSENCAFGMNSLTDSKNSKNSSFGSTSLYNSVAPSNNFAFGYSSLYTSVYGEDNCVFGYRSIYDGGGRFNSAFGSYSLFNTVGRYNSAFGSFSLNNIYSGNGNTAVGYYSLTSLAGGSYNSAFGDSSGSGLTSGSNNITIGYFAQVPTSTANNQVRIGNTSITYAGIQVAWTVTSDRNLKSNILSSNLGLGFITKLRPVSYTRKNDEIGRTEYGLIAQEVEEALKEEGIENAAMITVSDEGKYELRYNELLAPMIKSIQELYRESINEENEISKLIKDKNLEKLNLTDLENKYQKIYDLKEKILQSEKILNEIKHTNE